MVMVCEPAHVVSASVSARTFPPSVRVMGVHVLA